MKSLDSSRVIPLPVPYANENTAYPLGPSPLIDTNQEPAEVISFEAAQAVYDKHWTQYSSIVLKSLALHCLSENYPSVLIHSDVNKANTTNTYSMAMVDVDLLESDLSLAAQVEYLYRVLFPMGMREVQFFSDPTAYDPRTPERAIALLQKHSRLRQQLHDVVDQIIIYIF